MKITIAANGYSITVNGITAMLTKAELDLICALVNNPNIIMTKQMIIDQIYSRQDQPKKKIVEVLLCKAKKKLLYTDLSGKIINVWGRGYMFFAGEEFSRDMGMASSFRSIDLPSSILDTKWNPSLKRRIVQIVNDGVRKVDDVKSFYHISDAEWLEWQGLAK